MKKNSICIMILICVVIILVVVLFSVPPVTESQDDPIVTPTVTPTVSVDPFKEQFKVVDVEYTSLFIKTSAYFSSMQSPAANIVTDVTGLKKYTSIYNDAKLKENLVEFDEKYFTDKALIILAIQETSGANVNTLVSVKKFDGRIIVCNIERSVPEIGTCDMAMNYFVLQLTKNDVVNVERAIVSV